MAHVDLLIVGAGPTGLGAAYRAAELGLDYLLVERSGGPGGMAASVTDSQGFRWDLGGHVLHSHFEHFDKAIAEAGVPMRHPRRNGWVWIGGQLVRTPIQQQLTELPGDLRPDAESANLLEYYRNHCGAELTERFFRPFTEKMWATPLEQVDHSWTSLRNGSAERNVPVLRVAEEREPAEVRFPYPEGGAGRLWNALAAGLDSNRVRYHCELQHLDLDNRRAGLSSGEQIEFDHCLSSMPLPTLVGLLGDTQRARFETRTRESLRACQTYVVGLGFEGEAPPALADKSWLYCPDPDVAWHRATMLSNYDPGNAGTGRWSILFEVGRSDFRRVDDQAARQSIRESVARLGADLDTLVSEWDQVIEMGYPVPTLGRDELLQELDELLLRNGIRSRGRFGGWRYESCNQDYSWAQGVQAVDAAVTGAVAEDAYWHPEKY